MTIHTRLLALSRDPEIPRWCKLAIAVAAIIPLDPFDELVAIPCVLAYVWLRKRHVLERHGFGGRHAIVAVTAMVVVLASAGTMADFFIEMTI